MLRGQKQSGFTIVELLIVVVVIAILAAITIVAYNGIQNRAKSSAVQNTAAQVSKKIGLWQVDNPNTSPASLATVGLSFNGTTTSEYSPGSNGEWCATITSSNVSYSVDYLRATPSVGGCPGHASNGVEAITNYATNPHAVSTGSAYTNQTPAGSTLAYLPTGAQDSGSAFRVVTTAAGQMRLAIPHTVGNVSLNDTISIGVDLYSSVATSVQIEMGLSTGVYPKSSTVNLNVGWNRVETTVPVIASAGVTVIQLLGTAFNTPAGTTWMASRAIITKSTSPYNYADGNSANWSWNGTPNSSTSKGTPIL